MPFRQLPLAPSGMGCTRFYSSGSVASFINGFSAGQTACFHNGSYSEDVTVNTANIIISSGPNERATLIGRFVINAPGTTVEYMNLNGHNVASGNLPSPTVNQQASFQYDDVTNSNPSGGPCFEIGSYGGKTSSSTALRYDRIHGCTIGVDIGGANQTTVDHSVIFGNSSGGVEIYSTASSSQITNNIIDGNYYNVTFNNSASQNVVLHNYLTEGQSGDVNSWTLSGTGNSVDLSCITNTPGWSAAGVTKGSGNRFVAAPTFVNKAAGDYTPAAADACAGILQ